MTSSADKAGDCSLGAGAGAGCSVAGVGCVVAGCAATAVFRAIANSFAASIFPASRAALYAIPSCCGVYNISGE